MHSKIFFVEFILDRFRRICYQDKKEVAPLRVQGFACVLPLTWRNTPRAPPLTEPIAYPAGSVKDAKRSRKKIFISTKKQGAACEAQHPLCA